MAVQTGGRRIGDALRAVAEWLDERLVVERHQLVLWTPVALGAGIAGYFALPAPEQWLAVALAGAALAAFGIGARSMAARCALVAGLLVAAGVAIAWSRSERIAAPRLDRPMFAATFDATVASSEALPARGQQKLMLAPDDPALPPLIRVSVRGEGEPSVPVLGVIDQPIIGDRWLGARGRPTTFNGAACRVRSCGRLVEARIATTSPQAFRAEAFTRFERVRTRTRDTLYGGDCHNYGLLASGHLDAVIESGLQLYDFAALVPVIVGAGGVAVDWGGQALHAASDGSLLALGDASLTDEVLALLV